MRLSLRQKLVGGFGFLLALMALLGYVTFSLFGSIRTVQREVFDFALRELVAVDEIVRSYTAQSAAIRGYLISPSNGTLLDQYRTEVEVASEWQTVALELEPSPPERELLDRLIAAGDEFHTLVNNEVVPRAEEGQRTRAFQALAIEGDPLITRIELLGEQLRLAQDRVVAEAEAEIRTRNSQALAILIFVTAVSLALGIAFAYVIPRRLSRNIEALVRAARGIERGDFNQKIEIRSGDEIEELATRFEEMQAGLGRLQQLRLQARELEIAASIQRNLLQRTIPEPPGVTITPLQRQANLVGGDWYDLEISGRSLSVVIGDASGKGIAAALMATVTLSSLRAERGLGAGPKRIIERANKALKDATDPDSFTTLVYLTLDIETGAVRWFNMGHPAPFLLRRRPDGSVEGHYMDGPRNKALGWFDDPGLSDNSTELLPGDRLVLFTDGFLEAKDPDGELYGETRLASTLIKLGPLDGANLGEQLIGEVERFAAGKLDDDLTMLIVDFEGTEE